jgi:type VI protein secretion system component VasF
MESTSKKKLTKSGKTIKEWKKDFCEKLIERERKMHKIYSEKLDAKDRAWCETVAPLLEIVDDLKMKLQQKEESEATLRGQIKKMEKEDQEKHCYMEEVKSAQSGKKKKIVASVVAVTVLVGVGSLAAGWWFRS